MEEMNGVPHHLYKKWCHWFLMYKCLLHFLGENTNSSYLRFYFTGKIEDWKSEITIETNGNCYVYKWTHHMWRCFVLDSYVDGRSAESFDKPWNPPNKLFCHDIQSHIQLSDYVAVINDWHAYHILRHKALFH